MDGDLITGLFERGGIGGYEMESLVQFLAAAAEERDRLEAELERARRRLADASPDHRRLAMVQQARSDLEARRAAANARAAAILAAAELEAETILDEARPEAHRTGSKAPETVKAPGHDRAPAGAEPQ